MTTVSKSLATHNEIKQLQTGAIRRHMYHIINTQKKKHRKQKSNWST